MTKDPRIQELITLKTIAETLNQSNDLSLMLNTVLDKLLELTGLTTGWIFLIDGNKQYEFVADRHLPPALMHNEKHPMRCGTCWCLDRYWDGRLNNAVNILNCKRIENAIQFQWGDTCGITHHATVPLRSGDRRFGVLNVAAPGKTHFLDEELALLQAVAFQIGSAVERMRLYAEEQRRADLFSRLGEFSSALGMAANASADLTNLAERVMTLIGEHFEWSFTALFEPAGNDFVLKAVHTDGRALNRHVRFPQTAISWFKDIARDRRIRDVTKEQVNEMVRHSEFQEIMPPISSLLAAPVQFGSLKEVGILLVGYKKAMVSPGVDREVLEALSEHIAVVLESARLEENRHELARLEERNRLARDLHDSVSQILFSLSMTAKGVESLLKGSDPEKVLSAVRDIQSLSQYAQKEMRALIMQLRPAGLEAGLITALKSYGEQLGLRVNTQLSGILDLPRATEEALWRIGQEALNNVCKHAETLEAEVTLQLNASEALLRISDNGRGIGKQGRKQPTEISLGLTTIRERTEALGGQFKLTSVPRSGTTIEVAIPLARQ